MPDFIPLLKDKPQLDREVTVYVCENFACRQPVDSAAALDALLNQVF